MGKIKLKFGENPYCSNEDYHNDREFLSSSALKLLVNKQFKDFKNKYILNKKSNTTKASYELGTLIHTLLLEPENLKTDYAFYPGKVRRGKKFEIFKLKNKGKMILLKSTLKKGRSIVNKYKKRKSYKIQFKHGKSEITACGKINGVKVKARFDFIDKRRNLIIDVKSTWYNKIQYNRFVKQSRIYKYHLSAALYLEIARQTYGKEFEFAILCLSTQDGSHFYHSYNFERNDIKNGLDQVHEALKIYKKRYAP